MIKLLEKEIIGRMKTSAFDDQVEAMAKIGSWRLDLASNKITWSLNSFHLHGLSPDENNSFQEIVTIYEERSAQRFMTTINQLIENQHPINIDVKFNQTRANISRLTLRIQAQPVLDENGECNTIIGIFQDVEDAIEDKRLLRDSERRFKAIFNQSFQFVGLLNGDGELIEANETALNFGGFELEIVKGKKFWETPWFQHNEESVSQLKKAIQAARKGRLIRYETEIIGIGGNTLTMDLSIRPILDDKGEVMYLIPEGRDISDKREVHQQLIELNRELEKKVNNRTTELKEINTDLESFAYSISHDLRAPLRAITGFSQIIIEDYQEKLDHEGLRLLNVIISNSQRMSTLIDDLLLFSRTSRKEVIKSVINPEKLISGIIHDLITTKGYKHKFEFNKLPEIFADYGMITQVFINLIDNACKYSSKIENPEVSIEAKETATEVEFCITDNGVGFENESAKNLFQVFQRLHTSRQFEGTGVGLSIVRKIIEKHGGRVKAEGKLGKGAKFYFTIPKVV